MSTQRTDLVVRDNPAEQRWEALLDGAVAGFATYTRDGDTVTFVHTEVDPAHEGHGVGSAIITTSLDDARARGLRVVPQCPFYAAYVERHPAYADLVRS